jgi:hypothetical protein
MTKYSLMLLLTCTSYLKPMLVHSAHNYEKAINHSLKTTSPLLPLLPVLEKIIPAAIKRGQKSGTRIYHLNNIFEEIDSLSNDRVTEISFPVSHTRKQMHTDNPADAQESFFLSADGHLIVAISCDLTELAQKVLKYYDPKTLPRYINRASMPGRTALFLAIQRKNFIMIKSLLVYGALVAPLAEPQAPNAYTYAKDNPMIIKILDEHRKKSYFNHAIKIASQLENNDLPNPLKNIIALYAAEYELMAARPLNLQIS